MSSFHDFQAEMRGGSGGWELPHRYGTRVHILDNEIAGLTAEGPGGLLPIIGGDKGSAWEARYEWAVQTATDDLGPMDALVGFRVFLGPAV